MMTCEKPDVFADALCASGPILWPCANTDAVKPAMMPRVNTSRTTVRLSGIGNAPRSVGRGAERESSPGHISTDLLMSFRHPAVGSALDQRAFFRLSLGFLCRD